LSGGEWTEDGAAGGGPMCVCATADFDEPTAALMRSRNMKCFKRFAELTLGKMALMIRIDSQP